MKRKRLIAVIGAGTAAVVVVLISMTYVPVARHAELHGLVVWADAGSCSGIETLKGTTVSYHWWAPSNSSFGVWDCAANHIVARQNGTSGSGSFVAQGGAYEFGAPCIFVSMCVPINVSVNYTAPLLVI